ncbi:MAG: helix-turn-helix domain-containing protein [Prevotellaceae bacterium]|jgi:transcriptional antiterminator|nr:helix-turn-helix domain-containing protein [Prevotellaceae bacterium]
MTLFATIDRILIIHGLIKKKTTGTPDEFAERLHLKRRQLQNILDEIRDYGAEIMYDRIRSTYYYANNFEIVIQIKVNPLSEQEENDIFGGNIEKKFSDAILLHRMFVLLYS